LIKFVITITYGCVSTICHYHRKKYIEKYNYIYGKTCCNPLQQHKQAVKKGLREIKPEHLEKPKHINVNLVPGKSLCVSCYTKIFTKEVDDNQSEQDTDFTVASEQLETAEKLHNLDSFCNELNISPVTKIIKLNKSQRLPALEKKTLKISNAIKRKLETSFDETLKEIDLPSTSSSCVSEYDILLQKLKEKCATSNKEEKIKIISLLPESWSRKKICEEFKVTDYLVRLTRDLMKTQGILPDLIKKAGNPLSEEVINAVVEFYQDDENSRVCPGKKDCVSIGKKQYKQKRLLLLTLNELFVHFKQKYPHYIIGRSSFCALRPKWCVLPGASGTHSVCVCVYHQNVKLMTEALKFNVNYRDLLDFLVCNTENEICMLDDCTSCPGPEVLKEILENELDDLPDEITFKQWVSTDRANLISQVLPLEDFFDVFIGSFHVKPTSHST